MPAAKKPAAVTSEPTGGSTGVFRKEMALHLASLMGLLEATAGRRAAAHQLAELREAASILVFRLVVLIELGFTDAAATKRLARLQELTQHIREGAGSGASIFANAPDAAFDPAVTGWLDDLDQRWKRVDVETRRAWDETLAEVSALMTGQVEQVHRLLGDLHEQILAMVPKRVGSGIVLTAGEENERRALAAHSTPGGMVVEMVRPLMGVLFRDAWTQSGGEVTTYRRALLGLRVVDPAMGSAQLLTVVAHEIAKELAWVEVFGAPQPDTHFEYLENPEPWAEVPRAERLETRLRGALPEVVRRCCYGVDVKPLACELGKLALRLFAMTAAPELTFADSNIRTGDSLVGVTWAEATEILRDRLAWDVRALGEVSAELRWAYDLAVLAVWYPKRGALLDALRRAASDPRCLPRDARELGWGDLMMGKGAFGEEARDVAREAVRAVAGKRRAFHWELEFPDVMNGRKFDGVVANPPFRGDRDLRGVIGEDGVGFLRDRFTGTDTADYAGYFVLRCAQLLGERGALGTLGPNTLAQAKNRRVVLVPLVSGAGEGGRYRILRGVRSRPWPGEAAVHVCMAHLVPVDVPGQAKLVLGEAVHDVERISTFLDVHEETALHPLPSMAEGLVFSGMFPRGDFDRGAELLREVPARERACLKAYVNNDDVQQRVELRSTRVVIDFYDELTAAGLRDAAPGDQLAFLRARFPRLLREVEGSLRTAREGLPPSARNRRARERWWRHEEERPGLRRAWADQDHVIVFGAVSKCWVPSRVARIEPALRLEISPTHNLFVIPASHRALHAVLTSFPFEHHVRRRCGTLETRLSVAPTEGFACFPLPWPAVWSKAKQRPVALPPPAGVEGLLGEPMEAITSLRRSILVGADRSRIPRDLRPGGPTDLYNLYDDPSVRLAAIEELRALHVALSAAVLRAYGWDEDGPDGPALRLEWGFDRPWIDGTTRYVPTLEGRKELIARIAGRNARRFEEEMALCLGELLASMRGMISEKGVAGWRKENDVGLSDSEVVAALEYGSRVGRVRRVSLGDRRGWAR